MNTLSATTLRGIWASLLLPLDADGSINFDALREQIRFLTAAGVNGIYSNGTAAEFYNQTENEFDLIHQILAEECVAADVPFQVGASHMSPVLTLGRIERSLQFQPAAFQLIFPDWLPLTPEEQSVFLKQVADLAGEVPLVLYLPGHSKTKLLPGDFPGLKKQAASLIGIKVAATDDAWFDAMKENSAGLAVFIQGHRLATGMKRGVAVGSYSNIACFNPAGAVAWYRLMLEDIDEACAIEQLITVFFDTCIFPYAKAGYADPALDKLLAFAGGWSPISTRLRAPYKWIPEHEAMEVRRIAKKILPELLTRI